MSSALLCTMACLVVGLGILPGHAVDVVVVHEKGGSGNLEEARQRRHLQVAVETPSEAPTAAPTLFAHCSIHPNCVAQGFGDGLCCPMRDGTSFMACCGSPLTKCGFHPRCLEEGFSSDGECCPNDAGFHMECCDTTAPTASPTSGSGGGGAAAADDDDYEPEEGGGSGDGGSLVVVCIGFFAAMGGMVLVGFIYYKKKEDIWKARNELLKHHLRESHRSNRNGGGRGEEDAFDESLGGGGGGGKVSPEKGKVARQNTMQRPGKEKKSVHHHAHGNNAFDLIARASRAKSKARRSSRAKREKAWETAMAGLDADGDGELTFERFKEVCMHKQDADNAEAKEADLKTLFDLLDEDLGGTVDVKEMSHALRHNDEALELAKHFDALFKFVELAEIKSKKEAFKKAFKLLRHDGGGELEFEHFKGVCGVDDGQDETVVRQLFILLDEDKGGTVDVREMAHALKHNEEAMDLAKRFDTLHQFVELSTGRKKKKKRKMSKARRQSIARSRSQKEMGGSHKKHKHKHSLKNIASAAAMGAHAHHHKHKKHDSGNAFVEAFKKFDTDGSGQLEFEEFAAACGAGEDDMRVRELFTLLDKDQDGALSVEEMAFGLRANEQAKAIAAGFASLKEISDLANKQRKRRGSLSRRNSRGIN